MHALPRWSFWVNQMVSLICRYRAARAVKNIPWWPWCRCIKDYAVILGPLASPLTALLASWGTFLPLRLLFSPSPGPNLACCVLPRGERRKLDWGKYITRSVQIHNECSIGLGQIQCCGSWQIHHKYNVGSGQIHHKCNVKSGQIQNKWIEANTSQLDGLVQMISTPSPMSCMNLILKHVVTRHSRWFLSLTHSLLICRSNRKSVWSDFIDQSHENN